MITFLEGVIELKAEKFVVVKTSGIGYKVFAGEVVLSHIPERGGSAKLWIHHHIREDSQELYGFLHFSELEFFEMLLSIPGIGPKGGLGILGVAPVDTLKKAIASGDTSYLTRVSGVGKKTAEKVVLELRDKMAGKGVLVDAPELKEEADALDALVALGYSQREARDALSQSAGGGSSIEERVRAALQKFGKKKI